MTLKDEENKLLQAAAGYKGTPNIEEQLLAEAASDGLSTEVAQAIVSKVLKRLKKSESGKRGSRLGKAQDPIARANKLVKLIADMRSW